MLKEYIQEQESERAEKIVKDSIITACRISLEIFAIGFVSGWTIGALFF